MTEINKIIDLMQTVSKVAQSYHSSVSFAQMNNLATAVAANSQQINASLFRFSQDINGLRLGESLLKISDDLKKSSVFENIGQIGNTLKNLENNPEIQYGFIRDLELLYLNSSQQLSHDLAQDVIDERISKTEALLERNLLPYLDKLKLSSLWLGANYALASNDNPDKLRHCLISLRTILENLIDELLAPKSELSSLEMFKKEFKNYNAGKENIEFVKIKRSKKIEYFLAKLKFRFLDDFTTKDIDLICECYSILCNVHQPAIGITENQVRILKIKTGITIWLLSYAYQALNNSK